MTLIFRVGRPFVHRSSSGLVFFLLTLNAKHIKEKDGSDIKSCNKSPSLLQTSRGDVEIVAQVAASNKAAQ